VVTRKQWLAAVRGPSFPRDLRTVRGTLLLIAPLMTTDGEMNVWREKLRIETGLPLRTVTRHLHRAVDAGYLEHDIHGGHGRPGKYLASVPSCAPKVARNYPELRATEYPQLTESCGPSGGPINKRSANGSEHGAVVSYLPTRKDNSASTNALQRTRSTPPVCAGLRKAN
jgi:hypothetical protein